VPVPCGEGRLVIGKYLTGDLLLILVDCWRVEARITQGPNTTFEI